MTTFDDRERGEELRFQHDEELRFKIRSRRNRLFGLWLARERLHLPEAQQEAYAKAMAMADFEQPGNGDLLRKAREDLAAHGIAMTERALAVELGSHERLARAQVMEG